MTNQFGKVAVIFGGDSAEREVSLMSGDAVLQALRSQNVDAHPFDPSKQGIAELAAGAFHNVFIAMHGRGGEDGALQGALETMRLPYTGSGVMASAIAMDKWRTKILWTHGGIPTPKSCLLNEQSNWQSVVDILGLPIFVKPVHEGSSMGATKVNTLAELEPAWRHAAKYDQLVLAEEFIVGEELTVGFLGEQALPIVRIVAEGGKYDYMNKYFTDSTKYYCPSLIDGDIERRIKADAIQASALLGCRGWGRLDVMLRPNGEYLFLEMNTSPGMTGHSLVPMAAREAGIDFAALCLKILAGARLDAG